MKAYNLYIIDAKFPVEVVANTKKEVEAQKYELAREAGAEKMGLLPKVRLAPEGVTAGPQAIDLTEADGKRIDAPLTSSKQR